MKGIECFLPQSLTLQQHCSSIYSLFNCEAGVKNEKWFICNPAVAMLLLCCSYAVAMLLLCCYYAIATLVLCSCYAVAIVLGINTTILLQALLTPLDTRHRGPADQSEMEPLWMEGWFLTKLTEDCTFQSVAITMCQVRSSSKWLKSKHAP